MVLAYPAYLGLQYRKLPPIHDITTDPIDPPRFEALARLRTDLERLGLERSETMSESEDHFACLCEVMRYLIAGDDVAVANLTQQKAFFSAHLQPWVERMCDAVAAHPRARFYAALSGFTRAFLVVESQGFDMLT